MDESKCGKCDFYIGNKSDTNQPGCSRDYSKTTRYNDEPCGEYQASRDYADLHKRRAMSYDIRLKCPTCDRAMSIKRHAGKLVTDILVHAHMQIENDFGAHFCFKELDKVTGASSIPLLEEAVEQLGTEPDYNEFEDCSFPMPIRQSPLPEEAGHACAILLAWAKANPTAIWEVT